MATQPIEEKNFIESFRSLPPEKKSEVIDFIEFLKTRTSCGQRRNLKGLWKQFSVQIAESELKNLRREMWGDFPRGDKK